DFTPITSIKQQRVPVEVKTSIINDSIMNLELTTTRFGFLKDSTSIRLAKIPGGSFMMGSSEGRNDERPIHEVVILYPFRTCWTLLAH
ncbi:hypothetical protein ACFL4P_02815, partial [Gemmatimonadota bacterium]